MTISGGINVKYIMEDIDFAQISGKTVTLSYLKDATIVTQTFTATSATVVNLNLTSCTVRWIKLEIGDTASVFSPKAYGDELNLCRRYYAIVNTGGTVIPNSDNASAGVGYLHIDISTFRIEPTYKIDGFGGVYAPNGWGPTSGTITHYGGGILLWVWSGVAGQYPGYIGFGYLRVICDAEI